MFGNLWARSLSLLHSEWICFCASTFRDVVEHMLYNQLVLSVTVSQENLVTKYSHCFSDQIEKLVFVLLANNFYISKERS
jgi:succinate dehydrogenase/fumarate reductase cytochrome b subunit